MFAKLFEKLNPSPPHNANQGSVKLTDLEARVAVHYGIPSTASLLAFDPIQQLLAIGTLDGRIKVIGGSNVEGLLISPKPLPFKNLEFLQNQGFLVSVSNGNEIQVWDLENRRISSNLQWESNITAFSVIYGTHYMFVGDEYGYLSVLKYEAKEGSMELLPYHIPPNLIAEAAEISMPDQLAIVGLLPHPNSLGNRVLIAYENGLIILWDITEDRAVLIRGYKEIKPNDEIVVYASKDASEEKFHVSSHNQEGEKEISSLCWLSSDGSILAVGYVDGDILLWDLSASGKKSSETEDLSTCVVKLQLSAADKRLPVIVLRWSANNAQKSCGGHLFVYGGDVIGSEEVLTVLTLDWHSGIATLKCVGRVDLGLTGSFADAIVVSNANETGVNDSSSLFVLTNPGQLHFYDKTSLSALKSDPKKKHSDFAVQYPAVVPTLEPCMTVANLYPVDRKWNFSRTPSETMSNAQPHPAHSVTKVEIKMPLSGGVPGHPLSEDDGIKRIFVAGYQDGSVRLWDATFPVFSLIAVVGSQVEGIEITGPSTAISALDFSPTALTLAIGHQCGQVRVYTLGGQTETTSLNLVTDNKQDVQFCPSDSGFQSKVIFSLLKSSVCILKFVASGARLAAGFECGQVAMLDISSSAVLFVTDCLSSSSSPITSVAVKTLPDAHEDTGELCEEGTTNAYAEEIVFILTRDEGVVLLDSMTGKIISSQAVQPKEKSTAIALYVLDGITSVSEGSRKQASTQDNDVQPDDLGQKYMDSQILLCCQDGLHLFSLNSVIQGDIKPVHELNLSKPCSWTSIIKNDARKYGLILVYQTGDFEIRSLPNLDVLGEFSLMSILRWDFKINMDKTMSSPGKGIISLVNGCEFAIVSPLAFGNDFRIPEALPSLHDKSLAAAADDAVSASQHQKKKQNVATGVLGGIMKGLKGLKGEQGVDCINSRETLITHLENIFSRFPFSDPTTDVADDVGNLELNLADIEIDEPVHVTSSALSNDKYRRENETDRDRLFDGGSSDSKPRQRTREEIIAKYRNTGDAASAASQAKDKLIERQEKLERLSRNTEELQSGAENFADLAGELVKAMEKRKWWNL